MYVLLFVIMLLTPAVGAIAFMDHVGCAKGTGQRHMSDFSSAWSEGPRSLHHLCRAKWDRPSGIGSSGIGSSGIGQVGSGRGGSGASGIGNVLALIHM